MFCRLCGRRLSDIYEGEDICPECSYNMSFSKGNQQGWQNNQYGVPPYNPYNNQPYNFNGQPQRPNAYPYIDYSPANAGLKVLSFFVPLAGIIIYFVDRDQKPNSAKDCLKMSLISIGIQAALWILTFVFCLLIFSSVFFAETQSVFEDSTRVYYGFIFSALNILRFIF